MRILGINCMNHDAAMAVIDIQGGGDILWAAHAERYSKIKNDHFLNQAIVDEAMTIQLANGDGNTAITKTQTSAGAVTLTVAFSTSGDPGTSGTDNSGTGFVSFPKNDLSFTSGTLRMRFKAVAASSGDGTGSATISFTNNGVTNSDLDITLNFT